MATKLNIKMPDSKIILKKTSLHSIHIAAGAKMASFAGYEMPINYPAGIIKEHLHTRTAAGLFDVSHMGQMSIKGKDAWIALEKILPTDIKNLLPGTQSYSVLLNQHGGILDDLMIVCINSDHYVMVVNAACKDQDFTYLQQHIGDRLEVDMIDNKSLLALQGPRAGEVLSGLGVEVKKMNFMEGKQIDINDISCFILRSGYTGEDGFEISIDDTNVSLLAELLVAHNDVQWVGLGARDTLRLEAGLCLYGHDITGQVSPIEANIGWVISASRRKGGEREGGFPGAPFVLAKTGKTVDQIRVGLLPEGRALIREGVKIYDQDGNESGYVTSGGYSPTLNHPIAMGYVNNNIIAVKKPVYAVVRNKKIPLTPTSLPFVAHNYYR